jgi:hypothetical protein
VKKEKQMTQEDQKAAEDLAADLPLIAAVLFLRSESGLGLRECGHWAENLGRANPDSVLGKSYAERVANAL